MHWTLKLESTKDAASEKTARRCQRKQGLSTLTTWLAHYAFELLQLPRQDLTAKPLEKRR